MDLFRASSTQGVTMRHPFTFAAATALLCFAIGAAQAQNAASSPSTGMGPRSGMGMGPGGGMQGRRMGPDNTPGWSLMSSEERRARHDKMMGMTDHADCTAYMAQHQTQMVERAKAQGRSMPTMPRQDACAPLKK
jgi:hypothetical protein